MTDAHRHVFVLVDVLKRRYRCECGVYGYRHGKRLVPMTCSFKLDATTRCGAEAVVADGERNHNRCAAHAQHATESHAPEIRRSA
jgi:hypothetical protein